MSAEEAITVTPHRRHWLYYALLTAILLIAVSTLVGMVLAILFLVNPAKYADEAGGLIIVMLLLGAPGMIGLLLAAWFVFRHVETLSERIIAIDQQTAIMAEQSVARTQAHTFVAESQMGPNEMRDLLSRIHEVLLMPEEERRRRFHEMAEQELRQRLATTEHHIDTYDFHHAREELAALATKFGRNARIEAVERRLQEVVESARSSDMAEAAGQIDRAIMEARWEQAEHMARQLGDKYPDAPEPAVLIERVLRERRQFELNHRKRMHDEIQRFVNQRQWQEALSGARQFVETFPVGLDADALRAQMPTLEANAEIQIRQSIEKKIKYHLQKHHYWDALALARRIISEYPLSPQANVLRAQVPRLEELARSQPAPGSPGS